MKLECKAVKPVPATRTQIETVSNNKMEVVTMNNLEMMPITLGEVYDRLCAALTNYENPDEEVNGWTEENKSKLLYEDIVQIVNDIVTFPHEWH